MINETNIETAKQEYFSMTILDFCRKWHVGSKTAMKLFGSNTEGKKFKYQEERESKVTRECSRGERLSKGYVAPIPKEVLQYKEKTRIIAEEENALRSKQDYWKQDAGVIYNHYFS